MIAELFISRSLATNRERLNELRRAEQQGCGGAEMDAILRALACRPVHDPGRDRGDS